MSKKLNIEVLEIVYSDGTRDSFNLKVVDGNCETTELMLIVKAIVHNKPKTIKIPFYNVRKYWIDKKEIDFDQIYVKDE